MIENLLSNGIKLGLTNVSITVGNVENDFYVEVDGQVIPADEPTAIFEAGYSPVAEGTGFGLRIAKQVAEAHGWNIRATEGSNGGARFEITGIETVAD